MTVSGNGISHRGRGYMEAGAVKILQKKKKRKTTCSSRGVKKEGKMSSWKIVYAFKTVELKYTLQ